MTEPRPSAETAGDDRARFAADGALLVVANGLAGLLFLAVHIVLGRSMDGVDYAALVSLIGLLNVLSVGSNALQVAMARFTAGVQATDAAHFSRRVLVRVATVTPAALLLWLGASFGLRGLLEAPSVLALWLLGLVASLQLFTPLAQGLLQGQRLFGWLAAAALGGAGARLGAAGVVAACGGRVSAALLAFVAGALVSLALCVWPLRRRLASTAMDATSPIDMGAVDRYALSVAGGQLLLFTLMNADLILAQRLLDGDDLAAYGKAAMLARALIFLPLPVVLAMFPRAVVSARLRLLGAPLAFVAAVAVLSAALISLDPALPLTWIYGPDLEAAAPELARRYVWAAIPLVLLEVLIPYLWARDRPRTVLVLAAPAAGLLVALLAAVGRPEAMIDALGVCGALTFLLLLFAWRFGARRGAGSSAVGSAAMHDLGPENDPRDVDA
ncbi:MAG: hypothetical protein AAFY88_18685 [Acidobacteriota bacterium]